VPIGSTQYSDANGNPLGNNLGTPTISFDPTGKYGWILLTGDLTNDASFTTTVITLNSSDYGQTWSAPSQLYLENLPGVFPTSTTATNEGKTIVGSPQIAVDSAGNPHIAAIIGLTDTTSNTYGFFPFQELELYDLYFNPAVAGCSWQANFLSTVYGYNGVYLSDNSTGDANRIQISKTKDGKKIFIFWTDTDSATVAATAAASSGTSAPPTNTNPNLFAIGIDMGTRKITDKVNLTVGDADFGGATTVPAVAGGTLGGAFFPVVSPNVLNKAGGVYNVPVVLTQPDYKNATPSTWLSTNPAAFFYCQNVNFTQSQFVNRFDNAPPTLTVNGPDTVYIRLDSPYVHPTSSAHDCVYGNITPGYSSNVPLDGNGNTDSVGIFTSTWTASNPSGNTATHTQVVIVSAPPIAKMHITMTHAYDKFTFDDVSLNYPTNRIWYWGDGTSNNLNQTHATKVYTTGGQKCVILKVSNQYGTSSDTVCIQTYKTGINDVELSGKMNVFPNPSSGIMTLEMNPDIAQGAKVTVLNILGEEVSAPIEIKAGITSTILDLKYLDSGAYMLKIETAAGTAIKTIAINK
jgi:hypothetical protein